MIALKRPRLSVMRQCTLLQLNHSGVYYRPMPQGEANLELMRLIDAQFLETPYYGSRQMRWHLGRKRVRRLMPIMDRATRRVLAWRLSNTMDVEFCIEALQETLTHYGSPEIFNTDQGAQFTTPRFTEVLEERQICISRDGRGQWLDNVFIERLWRSLKYECVYLHAFETGSDLCAGLANWISHYNGQRPHMALGGRAPDQAYHDVPMPSGPGVAPDQSADSNAVRMAA